MSCEIVQLLVQQIYDEKVICQAEFFFVIRLHMYAQTIFRMKTVQILYTLLIVVHTTKRSCCNLQSKGLGKRSETC